MLEWCRFFTCHFESSVTPSAAESEYPLTEFILSHARSVAAGLRTSEDEHKNELLRPPGTCAPRLSPLPCRGDTPTLTAVSHSRGYP